MPASEHINPDQMVKMYHISWDTTPPHELEPQSDTLHKYSPQNNVHPDVLHMGTRRSAIQISRTHLHEYEVDPSSIDPVVYGDSPQAQAMVEGRTTHFSKRFNNAMSGKQQGLWETIPGNPLKAVETGEVIPYRNAIEDAGSVSYMVPKSAVSSGRVRYKGVVDLTKGGMRRKLEQEENLYK